MSKEEENKLYLTFKKEYIKRLQRIVYLHKHYSQKYKDKIGYVVDRKLITYKQFIDGLQYAMLTGQDTSEQPHMNKIKERQKTYYDKKYNISSY